MGVVPIVNENDTIAVSEIKFGDNDTSGESISSENDEGPTEVGASIGKITNLMVNESLRLKVY